MSQPACESILRITLTLPEANSERIADLTEVIADGMVTLAAIEADPLVIPEPGTKRADHRHPAEERNEVRSHQPPENYRR